MSVVYLNELGRAYLREVYLPKDFKAMTEKIGPVGMAKLREFLILDLSVAATLDGGFSVTTRYPDPWPEALQDIYQNFDYDLSKYFLGVLVMNLLIEGDEKWFCTKSLLPNHQNREYESNYYSVVRKK